MLEETSPASRAADLRVRGMENLWVAHASAMPTVPTGNVACAVVVLGERASDLILGAV